MTDPDKQQEELARDEAAPSVQEFELLEAGMDAPIEEGVKVPYPPAGLDPRQREAYEASLAEVARARQRGYLERE